MGNLRFIDSLAFFLSSLDAVVKSTPKENLKITAAMGSELLFQKGIYPYEYTDSSERFEETCLPEREAFYSNLTEEHITEEKYEHAKKVWGECGCKTMGNYHDLYGETDVALLADVLENFRKLGLDQYGLNPANYYTTPGLS